MHPLKKSRYAVSVSRTIRGEEFSAVYQTLTRAFVLLPRSEWSAMAADPAAASDPQVLEVLLEHGILVGESCDEMTVFENWKQQHVHDFSSVKSKVLVTRKCNNRCLYCIVDAEAKDMSPETAWAMDMFYLDFIRGKNPTMVEDEYSGGEAFLNPAVVLESASRRFFYCLGKGIEYGFSVVSNGTLIKPSIVSEMKKAGLKGLRVSIAGPEEVHDRLRPSRWNGKTYKIIVENLRAISGMTSIGVECQYDSGSRDYLRIPEMLDDLAARGVAIDNVVFTPIVSRRGKDGFSGGTGDPGVFLQLMQEAEKRGYPQFAEPPSNACSADFRGRLVFDTDGSIIACPALQSDEKAYGSIFKGVDFTSHSELLRRRLPERCLKECELLPVCMGGCRLQALTACGDFNGIDCQYDMLDLILKEYVGRKADRAIAEAMEKEPEVQVPIEILSKAGMPPEGAAHPLAGSNGGDRLHAAVS